jgi:hypothetical protein
MSEQDPPRLPDRFSRAAQWTAQQMRCARRRAGLSDRADVSSFDTPVRPQVGCSIARSTAAFSIWRSARLFSSGFRRLIGIGDNWRGCQKRDRTSGHLSCSCLSKERRRGFLTRRRSFLGQSVGKQARQGGAGRAVDRGYGDALYAGGRRNRQGYPLRSVSHRQVRRQRCSRTGPGRCRQRGS